jgi:hypothetical protein
MSQADWAKVIMRRDRNEKRDVYCVIRTHLKRSDKNFTHAIALKLWQWLRDIHLENLDAIDQQSDEGHCELQWLEWFDETFFAVAPSVGEHNAKSAVELLITRDSARKFANRIAGRLTNSGLISGTKRYAIAREITALIEESAAQMGFELARTWSKRLEGTEPLGEAYSVGPGLTVTPIPKNEMRQNPYLLLLELTSREWNLKRPGAPGN